MANINISTNNLDVNSIVNSLIQPQTQKIQTLQKQQDSYQVKLSSLGNLKSKVSSLDDIVKKIDSAVSSNLSSTDIKNNFKSLVQNFNEIKNINDNSTRGFNSKLREQMDSNTYKDLGISFDKTGKMSFDESKFDTNYTNNLSDTQNKLNTIFDNVSSNTFKTITDNNFGRISLQEQNYTKKIKNLEKQEDNLNRQKDLMVQTYQTQFNSVQKYLNQMNNHQSSISSLLNTTA